MSYVKRFNTKIGTNGQRQSQTILEMANGNHPQNVKYSEITIKSNVR